MSERIEKHRTRKKLKKINILTRQNFMAEMITVRVDGIYVNIEYNIEFYRDENT